MPYVIKIIGFGNKKEMLNNETAHYIRLLQPYATVSLEVLKPPSKMHDSRKLQRVEEGKVLCSHWPKRCYPVALSEEGKAFDSISFSQWLAACLMNGIPLLLNIGSAYGLSPSLKKKCKEVISLSPFTFPHRLCYVILVEQIYRAFTILKGHPYHK